MKEWTHSGAHACTVDRERAYNNSNLKGGGRAMSRTRKKVVTFVLVPLLFMGMAQAARAYTYFIDQFSVTKNGETLFTDSFNAGSPPPSAPNGFSYSMQGTMGPENSSSPGKLTIDSSGAIVETNAIGQLRIEQGATLQTDVNPNNTTLGLKSTDTFSVTGVFDLVVPPPTVFPTFYGVFLSDATATNDQEDLVRMTMGRNPANLLGIGLQQQDFVSHTITNFGGMLLVTGHEQIALTLTRGDVNSNAVTGSFAYIDGGVVGPVTTFASTASIFSDETFTRAGFEANAPVPEPSAMLFLVPGLVGLAAVRRRLKK